MIKSEKQEEQTKKVTEINTFPVPLPLEEKKEKITITTSTPPKPSREQIINQAFKFHSQGNISEAAKYYQYFIDQGFSDHRVFANYGVILKDLGNLKEAEFSNRKAIELKPDFADAHYNLGNVFKDLGELQEAELSYHKTIEIKPDYAEAHLNLGIILNDRGKLQEAELSCRKAIEIKPDYAEAHYNLGNILSNLGKLQNSESSYRKAIELNPDFAKAYYSLSLLKYSDENKVFQDQLFSENILVNKSQKDLVDIYFARANVHHKEKNYIESAKYLKLANNLKLDINPSNSDTFINKSKELLFECDKKELNRKQIEKYPESIFIVGMFRSGSTLLESILSMRNDVYDLDEINILEESFYEYKQSKQEINLAELYKKKVNNETQLNITTNKWLYNYQYAGIIARHIPNAKIIHCFRHPLDNILSIYRTNFAKGNQYSSSLIDSVNIYLDQDEIMT